MQINSYKINNPSFGLIQLKPNDLNKSEKLLEKIVAPNLTIKEKNTFAINLYELFVPYLQQEAKLKAKSTYVLEEVFSDIKVKFWEFIYEMSDKNIINDLILKIDEYKPHKILSKFKYSEHSLDEPLPKAKHKTYMEFITSENLPIPQSEVTIEEIKNKLNNEITSAKVTPLSKRRLIHRSKGLTYSDIAKKEGVGAATARKSVKKGIIQLQRKNNVISEENKMQILNIAELLGTTFEKALDLVTTHIQILSSSSEVITRNIETLTKDLKISKVNFVKIALKHPLLFYQKPETINKNIDKSAELFGISRDKFITVALKVPQLFSQNTETLRSKIDTFTKLFEISKIEFLKVALKHPKLFSQKPETLYKNIDKSAELFGIQRKSFINAALRQPPLFYQSPQTLNKNVKTFAKIFKISMEESVLAALKIPQLFSYSPQTLKKNIETVAKKLRVLEEVYIRVALKRPQLFAQKPETIDNNVKTSAKFLNINKSTFIQAALKQPQLFYQKPETINNNVEEAARVLGISKSDFVKMALKQPSLFYQKAETISRKSKIINYYRTLKHEDTKQKISIRNFSTSDENLYKNIFIHIIQNKYFPKLNKNEIKTKLPELLSPFNDTITIEIPSFELVEDFIKFAEEYSKNLVGKNILKVLILPDYKNI